MSEDEERLLDMWEDVPNYIKREYNVVIDDYKKVMVLAYTKSKLKMYIDTKDTSDILVSMHTVSLFLMK